MRLLAIILLGICATSCATGGASAVRGNENGSTPVNEKEAYEYQHAINRCHRTGGTRVVKVMGELRCY